jgi:hypothetical protein
VKETNGSAFCRAGGEEDDCDGSGSVQQKKPDCAVRGACAGDNDERENEKEEDCQRIDCAQLQAIH